MRTIKNKKKPWLAAILNIILIGSGYIYNGKRLFFGWILLISYLIAFGVAFFHPQKLIGTARSLQTIAAIMFFVAVAYDA